MKWSMDTHKYISEITRKAYIRVDIENAVERALEDAYEDAQFEKT